MLLDVAGCWGMRDATGRHDLCSKLQDWHIHIRLSFNILQLCTLSAVPMRASYHTQGVCTLYMNYSTLALTADQRFCRLYSRQGFVSLLPSGLLADQTVGHSCSSYQDHSYPSNA